MRRFGPLNEYREKLLGWWIDARHFWKDRRTILAQPVISLESPRRIIRMKPLQFALQATVAPPTMFALVVSVVTAFLPPSPTAQLRDQLKEVEVSLARTIPLTADIKEQLSKSKARVAEMKRKLTRLDAVSKTQDVLNSWLVPLLGLSVIVSAYTFRWFLRRRTAEFPGADRAHVGCLYVTSAVLLLPNTLAALAFGVGTVAAHLEWDEVLYACVGLKAVALLWGLWELRDAAAKLTGILAKPQDDGHKSRVVYTRLSNRLALSQIFGVIATYVVAFAVSLPVFWVAMRAGN